MKTNKHEILETSVTSYLDNDLRDYAVYTIEERAIPSVIDGLKPTQRKVIFIANKIWKTGSEKPLKIFQLTGKVASDANYHHGDGSANSAIVGLAQKFKNAMPLLDEIGQFGSLRSPEAGAPRYISTRLHPNFRLLYKDFELLESKWDEGYEIEPKFFLPIIPSVLLNGGQGIATGFASNILNRNPVHLIDSCLNVLNGKPANNPSPYYYGFTGPIESVDHSWLLKGKWEVKNTTTLEITELPPSMTYEKFEAHLIDLEESKQIVSYDNFCTDKIKYVIRFRREDLAKLQTKPDGLSKLFKLVEKKSENFTVLDEFGKIKIFNSTSEIIEYFVKFRLTYYDKRKQYQIKLIRQELNILKNRAFFIKNIIIDKTLIVNGVTREQLEDQLVKLNFDKQNDSFSYLVNMPIINQTIEKYNELIETAKTKKAELEKLLSIEPIDMYREDLKTLKKAISSQY
jgi:DNA topoisomerase-2